jgi:hypothetical protein
MMPKTIALVQQHARQMRAIAADFARIEEQTHVNDRDSAGVILACSGIRLLLLTAADDAEDLRLSWSSK